MRLALDLPTDLLAEFSPLGDLDYALVHRVLNDDAYAAFYAQQAKLGRQVILDNPPTPDGPPLATPDVALAVTRIMPTFVIAGASSDPHVALARFREVRTAMQTHTGVGIYLCGSTQMERMRLFLAVHKEAAMLVLPGTHDGVVWLEELWDSYKLTIWPPYLHFMACGNISYLEELRTLCEELGLPRRRLSVNSAYPFRYHESEWRVPYDIAMLRKFL